MYSWIQFFVQLTKLTKQNLQDARKLEEEKKLSGMNAGKQPSGTTVKKGKLVMSMWNFGQIYFYVYLVKLSNVNIADSVSKKRVTDEGLI